MILTLFLLLSVLRGLPARDMATSPGFARRELAGVMGNLKFT